MLLTWRSTVLGLMNSAWAIARLAGPPADRQALGGQLLGLGEAAGQHGPGGAGQRQLPAVVELAQLPGVLLGGGRVGVEAGHIA
jgi:hypothetical protein